LDKWNEKLYLAVNAEVGAAVARHEFTWHANATNLLGCREAGGRVFIPGEWDEAAYLKANPYVAAVGSARYIHNGYHHYLAEVAMRDAKMACRPSTDHPAEVSGACSKAHVLVFSNLSGLNGSMPLHKVPYMPF
jgi:hypothetical protein